MMVIQSEAEFDELLGHEQLILVTCITKSSETDPSIASLMEQLVAAYGDRIKVSKIDMDTHPFVNRRFGIRTVPSVLFFHHARLEEVVIGVKPYKDFVQAIERNL